jgi:hypothetical protein
MRHNYYCPRKCKDSTYAPAETGGFLALADAQPTTGRRGWSAWARAPG